MIDFKILPILMHGLHLAVLVMMPDACTANMRALPCPSSPNSRDVLHGCMVGILYGVEDGDPIVDTYTAVLHVEIFPKAVYGGAGLTSPVLVVR